jgi:PAS domain-containing protein
MSAASKSHGVAIITIPTSDAAFSQMVKRLAEGTEASTPGALEATLRRIFPRAVVRAREISGEPPAWYIYRDGGWREAVAGPWWEASGLPRLRVTRDGWVVEANATALGLLEIEPGDIATRHFTDFVLPGTVDDSLALFDIVDRGNALTATVLLRPSSGHVIAVDLHARRDGDSLLGVLRLADDVEPSAPPSPVEPPPVRCLSPSDGAFRGYVELALARMPEPTPEGLALRLRRLYPHAEVTGADGQWLARREPEGESPASGEWWAEPGLPSVRYDAQALIVEANSAAEALLGRPLIGHYWQEFVTPGSTEQVSAMLAILGQLGHAESRFRMPRSDGSLLEFDSYTEVDGESYTTVMRPTTSRADPGNHAGSPEARQS